MTRLLTITFILLTLLGCHTSKRTVYLPGDDQAPKKRASTLTAEKPVDVAALETKYGDVAGVYLEYLAAYEHIVSGFMDTVTWSSYETSRERIVVLDPKDKNMQEFTRRFSGDKEAKAKRLYVTHPGQNRIDYSRRLLKTVNQEGQNVLKFRIPDLERGSIIDFQLELTNQQPSLMEEFPLQFDIPAEQIDIKYTYPKKWQAHIKDIRPGVKPNHKESYDKDRRKNIITATASDVPAMPEEPFEPYFKESADYLHVQLTRLKSGPIRYKAPESWEDFVEDHRDQVELQSKGSFFSGGMRFMLLQVTTRDMSPREKADRIVAHIQQEIDLENTNHNILFQDLWREKSGNIWLNTLLACELMREAELRPDLMMIHTPEQGHFDQSLIHGSQLPIPAVRVQIDGEQLIYFPSIRNLPANFIPPYLQHQDALIIPDQGGPRFIKVPPGEQSVDLRNNHYQVRLHEKGNVTIDETITMAGGAAYRLRNSMEHMDQEEREQLLKSFISFNDGEVEWKTKAFENTEDLGKPLRVKLSYEINNLLSVFEDEVLFNPAGLFSPLSEIKIKVDSEDREQEVVIHHDRTTRREIHIQYPAKWDLLEKPVNHEKVNDFGNAQLKCEDGSGKMTICQEINLKRSRKPKEEWGDLLDLMSDSNIREVPTLIFEIGN